MNNVDKLIKKINTTPPKKKKPAVGNLGILTEKALKATPKQSKYTVGTGGVLGSGGTKIRTSSGRTVGTGGEYWEGGTLAKIFDVLQTPQYIMTGALTPGLSIGEALANRVTPAKALGLTGFSAFAVDILADPIWLMGGGVVKGGLKAVKEGTAKATLGAGVKAGEKTLFGLGLTASHRVSLPKMIGLGGVEKKLASGLTKLGQKVKSTRIGGSLTEKLGGVRAIEGVKGVTKGLSLEDIEKGKKGLLAAKDIDKALNRAIRAGAGENIVELRKSYQKLQKAKLNDVEKALLMENLHRAVQGRRLVGKMGKKTTKFYDEILPLAKSARTDMEKVLKSVVPESALTGVTKKGYKDQSQRVIVRSTKLAPTAAAEKQKEFFRAVIDGKDIVFQGKGNIVQRVSDGKEFAMKRVGKNNYILSKHDGRIYDNMATKIKELTKESTKLTKELGRKTVGSKSHANMSAKIMGINKDIAAKKIAQKELGEKGALRVGANPVEINRALKAAGKKPALEEDIFAGITVTRSGETAIKGREVTANAAKNNSNLSQVIPNDGVIPVGFKEYKLKTMNGYMGPEQVVDALEEVAEAYTGSTALEKFYLGWNKVQNEWKKLSTFANPAFHTRNFVSNLWQLALAGTNPTAVWEGHDFLRNVSKLRGEGLKGKKLQAALVKKFGKEKAGWYDEFLKDGNIQTGRFFGDINKALAKDNFLFEWGGKAGSYLEDSSKLALYFDRRTKGYVHKEAAREARKYLFDYGDLTDFEKVVMKSAMPFYAWSRKNIPLQLSVLVQKPGKIALLPKVKRLSEQILEGEPMDENLLPAYMRDGLPLYLGQRGGEQSYFNLQGYIPSIDLAQLGGPTALGEMAAGQVTPLIKTFIEVTANHDLFLDKQIKEFEGHTEPIFGISGVDPRVRELTIELVRPVRDIERALGLSPGDVGKDISPYARAARWLGGINIKSYSPQKQADILEMITEREVRLIEREADKLRDAGRIKEADDLMDVTRDIKSGKIPIDL